MMDNFNPEDWIIWEDENIIVINKPSGVLTIQDGYTPEKVNLRQIFFNRNQMIWIVHRLDKETSGILVLAKNTACHRGLSMQFEQRTIHKEYHAIIYGTPDWQEVLIENNLLINADRKHRTLPNSHKGKRAITGFRLIKSSGVCSLISAFPKTGYRHQIRAHLNGMGFGILGDNLYEVRGNPVSLVNSGIGRTALHAYSTTFFHPVSGEKLQFSADYPSDFLHALKYWNLGD